MSGVITSRAFFVGLAVLLIDAERTSQIGIEFARRHRGFADITLLRCLAEAAGHRGARPVRIGEVGAAVKGVIRWLLKPAWFLSPLPGGERPARRAG